MHMGADKVSKRSCLCRSTFAVGLLCSQRSNEKQFRLSIERVLNHPARCLQCVKLFGMPGTPSLAASGCVLIQIA